MKIIILEGIATSGKTSIQKRLVDFFTQNNFSYSLITESETLMPILDNIDKKVSIDFLKKIIEDTLENKYDYIIFDRLFLTHIFRTNSTIEDFQDIINLIQDHSLTILLTIDEDKILDRINHARVYRQKQWNDYVSKKGSDENIYQYYRDQQRFLISTITNSNLNYQIYNTSDSHFNSFANNIIDTL
jgi:thymidylate kinase